MPTWSIAGRQALTTLWHAQVSSGARERRDTLALLLATALVAAPHVEHLPLWATAVIALVWLWRLGLLLAQRPLPPRWLLIVLLVAVTGGVLLEFRTIAGRDAGVTLLLLLGLKLLELRARRDVFVVVFLSLFVLLAQFMFGQALLVAALAVLAVVALFWVLVSVNLAETDLPARRKLAIVGRALLHALPLAAVMFVLFPRLSGPLWSIGTQAATARSGLSDTMAPGSVGELLLSEEIAFRVSFDAAPPPRGALYWRGPVLARFDGRTWSPVPEIASAGTRLDFDPASAVEYTVTLEPHERPWLFALEMPALDGDLAALGARRTGDGQLLAARPVTQRQRYAARSYTRFALGDAQREPPARLSTQLPAGFNPRTLAFAQQLRQSAADGAPAALVAAVLDHFRRNEFFYTLQPPPLGRDSVDEFLFDTRRGFCEHYASAFVVLMRALGVPARVVTGYHGGEVNAVDGAFTVRQADAHAWAEVWLAGRGWVRVDPTAAVDPTRVDQTARAARSVAQPAGAALINLAPPNWLRQLRWNWEAVENAWNQWVLTYSAERQRNLMERLGLRPTTETVALVCAAALAAALLLAGLLALRQRVRRDPLAEAMAVLRERLQRAGVAAAACDGPRALRERLGAPLAEPSRATAAALLAEIEHWRYATGHVPPARLRALRRAVRSFRPRRA
ncbi:MAG: transglutaminaseTgpA domain-containing protein [Betaproteobacteria bacterium]